MTTTMSSDSLRLDLRGVALLVNPADMQRPIAVLAGTAVIGRPSERVLEVLD